ncbi:MAG TPA: outer membrane beta-barrel protein [Candidatus Acidoferrales bacterium]|nr:outer membrane beta-barrel protein [Candidatus Acidoferrales bacterium]
MKRMLRRSLWIIPAMMLMCLTASAQSFSEWDVAGNYSYWDANLNGTQFHLMGGGGSLTENVNSWFGGRLEFNAYSGTEATKNVSAQTITYGPVLSYRRFSRLVPFGNLQIGAIHASQGYLGISESAFKFDLTGGGGIDYDINSRAAIRAEGDYVMTRFLDLRQDNLRFSVGLVIHLGPTK